MRVPLSSAALYRYRRRDRLRVRPLPPAQFPICAAPPRSGRPQAYVADARPDHGALDCLVGGVIDLRKVEQSWDETLRMTAAIRPEQSPRRRFYAPARRLPSAERLGQGAARDRLSRTDPVNPRLDLRSGAQASFQRRAQQGRGQKSARPCQAASSIVKFFPGHLTSLRCR